MVGREYIIRPLAPRLLILTPVKDAEAHLDGYFENLGRLEHPASAISLGFLESDSADGTYEALAARLPELRGRYARVTLVRREFGFRIPPASRSRWEPWLQLPRRAVLARSRNHLLFAALRDEEWVLWLDVDVVHYPPDVIGRLLGTGREIVTPHCVITPGGASFDWNSWRDQGRTRLDALRDGPELVRLDAVGTTMLLVRADVHRDGLIFPPFLYGRQSPFARDPSPHVRSGPGEIESEGLGLMAKDMGHECWGMPGLEILHSGAP